MKWRYSLGSVKTPGDISVYRVHKSSEDFYFRFWVMTTDDFAIARNFVDT